MAQLRDFYIRPESDPAHRPEQLEVTDDIESLLQQIKMTLFTNKGEVLGEPDFGLEVEKYLFEFNVNPHLLTKEAYSQLDRYVGESRKRDINIRPAVYNDDKSNRDIFVLLIDIPEVKNTLSIFYD